MPGEAGAAAGPTGLPGEGRGRVSVLDQGLTPNNSSPQLCPPCLLHPPPTSFPVYPAGPWAEPTDRSGHHPQASPGAWPRPPAGQRPQYRQEPTLRPHQVWDSDSGLSGPQPSPLLPLPPQPCPTRDLRPTWLGLLQPAGPTCFPPSRPEDSWSPFKSLFARALRSLPPPEPPAHTPHPSPSAHTPHPLPSPTPLARAPHPLPSPTPLCLRPLPAPLTCAPHPSPSAHTPHPLPPPAPQQERLGRAG